MDKKTIGCYLGEIQNHIENGKFIEAHRILVFVKNEVSHDTFSEEVDKC